MKSQSTAVSAVRPAATRMQHAIRLLTIIAEFGEPTGTSDPQGTVRVIRAEMKIQALDFWLRNPDYLADELLSKVDCQELATEFIDVARGLLDDPEPDLRWYPMPKWIFGAYEALDDAFSLLESYGLAILRRIGGVNRTFKNQFYLTEKGAYVAKKLTEEPVLSWYAEQAKLVHLVAGEDNGKTLKARQYQQIEYANAELGRRIGSIASRVRQRLDGLIADSSSDGGRM